MSHKKIGPDLFSRFDVYWIQTNKQTNRQTDRQAEFIYRLIKIFQNCFLGKIVAGVLGKPDPDFSSFQNLLAISELVHGWIKNRLCAETETYLTTCRKYKGRVLYGIKTPEE